MTLPVPTIGDSISLSELDTWLRETLNRKTGRPLSESLIASVDEFIRVAVETYGQSVHHVAVFADALRFPAARLDECRMAIEQGLVDSLFVEAYATADVMQKVCDPFSTGILQYAISATIARHSSVYVWPGLNIEDVRFLTMPVTTTARPSEVWSQAQTQQGAFAFAGFQRLFFSHLTTVVGSGPEPLESKDFAPSTSCSVGTLLSPLEWLSLVQTAPRLTGYGITADAEWLAAVARDAAIVGRTHIGESTLRLIGYGEEDSVYQCSTHRVAIG